MDRSDPRSISRWDLQRTASVTRVRVSTGNFHGLPKRPSPATAGAGRDHRRYGLRRIVRSDRAECGNVGDLGDFGSAQQLGDHNSFSDIGRDCDENLLDRTIVLDDIIVTDAVLPIGRAETKDQPSDQPSAARRHVGFEWTNARHQRDA